MNFFVFNRKIFFSFTFNHYYHFIFQILIIIKFNSSRLNEYFSEKSGHYLIDFHFPLSPQLKKKKKKGTFKSQNNLNGINLYDIFYCYLIPRVERFI